MRAAPSRSAIARSATAALVAWGVRDTCTTNKLWNQQSVFAAENHKFKNTRNPKEPGWLQNSRTTVDRTTFIPLWLRSSRLRWFVPDPNTATARRFGIRGRCSWNQSARCDTEIAPARGRSLVLRSTRVWWFVWHYCTKAKQHLQARLASDFLAISHREKEAPWMPGWAAPVSPSSL